MSTGVSDRLTGCIVESIYKGEDGGGDIVQNVIIMHASKLQTDIKGSIMDKRAMTQALWFVDKEHFI